MIAEIQTEIGQIVMFTEDIWKNAKKLPALTKNGIEFWQMYKMPIYNMCCNMKADFLKNTQSGYIKLIDTFTDI